MGQNRVSCRHMQGGWSLRVSRARDTSPPSIPLPSTWAYCSIELQGSWPQAPQRSQLKPRGRGKASLDPSLPASWSPGHFFGSPRGRKPAPVDVQALATLWEGHFGGAADTQGGNQCHGVHPRQWGGHWDGRCCQPQRILATPSCLAGQGPRATSPWFQDVKEMSRAWTLGRMEGRRDSTHAGHALLTVLHSK